MNQLHHIELPPRCLHNAPRLPPVRNQPQTRMNLGFFLLPPLPSRIRPVAAGLRGEMCQAWPSGGPFFHFQQLAHLAAFEVIGPPLHQFGAVFKVGPTVVSSPRAIALDVGQAVVHTTPP
jgi:hypothetical protein